MRVQEANNHTSNVAPFRFNSNKGWGRVTQFSGPNDVNELHVCPLFSTKRTFVHVYLLNWALVLKRNNEEEVTDE